MMHRYAVYHAVDLMQMVFPDPSLWSADRDQHYRHVANVEADVEDKPLEQVFRLTNHLDERPWTENAAVVWHDATRPLRSTSVGDVAVDEDTGEVWMVLTFGWKQVERP